MRFSIEFLGSGTSVGVPVIGCGCAVCHSSDPRNNRLRSSALVRSYDAGGKVETTVLIDTSADFRQQMLRAGVRQLDAVIITHHHADHIAGIDDVRRFNTLQNRVIDCYASFATLDSLRKSFGYVFAPGGMLRPGLPNLKACPVAYGDKFRIGSLTFKALELDHQIITTLGLRISCGAGGPDLAYCLDVKRIPPAVRAELAGVDTLVLDMLREKSHPTHLNLDEALEIVRALKPRRTVFSHLAHEVDHAAFQEKLPQAIRLAHDGLIVAL